MMVIGPGIKPVEHLCPTNRALKYGIMPNISICKELPNCPHQSSNCIICHGCKMESIRGKMAVGLSNVFDADNGQWYCKLLRAYSSVKKCKVKQRVSKLTMGTFIPSFPCVVFRKNCSFISLLHNSQRKPVL